jgi:NAD+ diphosphatase
MKPSESDRALECMECGNVVFPRISPAVTVNIINNNKILLVRNNGGPFKRFAQVAGYVEIGESFEDTVKREVFEEVGLRVKNIKYYKNQPWGLSDTQMIGYTCELSGDDKFKIQEDEIQEARWFSADEIPPDIADRSLTYEMIGNFRRKFIEQTGETGKYHEFEHLFDRDIYKTQQ